MVRLVALLIASLAVVLSAQSSGAPSANAGAVQIIHVKPGASGLNSGATWAQARSLQSALASAGAGSRIWVMQGTYKPTTGASRETSFVVPSGVSVLGGFGGTETLESQRSPSTRITTLSGNIGNTIIATDNSCHVIRVSPGVTGATLDGFTISAGRATGACASANGAGALVEGAITLFDLRFEGNRGDGRGGALYGTHAVALANSELIENQADDGGAVGMSSAEFSALNTRFEDNIAESSGGGIFSFGDVSLVNSFFLRNDATGTSGGAVYATAVTSIGGLYMGNTAPNTGGAIRAGSLEVSRTSFDGNRANTGAGVYVQGGTADISDSTFKGHDSPGLDATPTVVYLNTLQPTVLTNVTISNNDGVGIEMLDGDLTVVNSTIADNTSGFDGGAIGIFGATPGKLTFRNSIAWTSGPTPLEGSAANPPLVEDSIVEGGCVPDMVCNRILTANPQLEAFALNGGSWPTRRIPPGSPAVDAGNNATCATEDARGVARTVDGDTDGAVECDLGAYELDDLLVGFTRSSATRGEAVGSAAVGVALSRPAAGEVTVNVAADGPAGDQPDYSPVADSVTFSPGATATAVAVTLANDYLVEPSEEIVLTLSDATGGAAILREESTLVIKDNEPRGKCNGQPATMAGNSKPNTINGTSGADVVIALGGNDTVNGRGGNDLICGGNGNDKLNGGPGLDAIFGANGADRITGGGANDFLRGQAQADSIAGGGGNDDIRGGGGNDTLGGGPGGDTLLGERGADRIDGGNGNDRLGGGPGRPDRCDGGAGSDALVARHGCEVRTGVP